MARESMLWSSVAVKVTFISSPLTMMSSSLLHAVVIRTISSIDAIYDNFLFIVAMFKVVNSR